jgi:phosphoribosylformylglycinamidine cyclo-ligase
MSPAPKKNLDLTLEAAGVSRATAACLLRQIVPLLGSTDPSGCVLSVPDFCCAIDLGDGQALVATTDGVGTKRALMGDRLEDLGRDLVAYNVNDVAALGVQPLALLNYLSFGFLDPSRARALIEGMAAACREAGCVLLGGETAEHPDIQGHDQLDLAAFAVGIATHSELITGTSVAPGDEIIGVTSTGPQASGFSLIRRAFERARQPIPDYFLVPTAVYVPAMHAMRQYCDVHAIANICDGGLTENLARSLPESLRAVINLSAWPRPAWVEELLMLGCQEEELQRVVNMGIGYVFVVPPADAESAQAVLKEAGHDAWRIGRVEIANSTEQVTYVN